MSVRQTATTLGIYAAILWVPLVLIGVYGRDAWDGTSSSVHHWYVALSLASGVLAVGKTFIEGERRWPALLGWGLTSALFAAVLLPGIAAVALLLST